MSGGSYDYLYTKDNLGDLYHSTHYIETMERRLRELGATWAADETAQVLAIIRQADQAIYEIIHGRLEIVWQSVEWGDSGDYSQEQVEKAIKDISSLFTR